MNKDELKKLLDEANIRPESYSLHGTLTPDAMILKEIYGKFVVYYLDERGNRNEENVFHNEESACQYFYDEIVNDPSAKNQNK